MSLAGQSRRRGDVALPFGAGHKELPVDESGDPYLILGDADGERFTIAEGEAQVGRAQGNNLQLADDSVSRHHARLIRNGPIVFIDDLGSSNGTFVNDHRITERVRLNDGDSVGFADISAVFRSAQEAAPSPDSPLAPTDSSRRKLPPDAALEGVGLPPVLLDQAETVIGRGVDNDVVLDDPAVSSHHASIRRTGEDFVLTDLESANGTYVNRERVQVRSLQPGDELQIGDSVLIFRRLTPVRRPAPGAHQR